jgi:hypothetical protein
MRSPTRPFTAKVSDPPPSRASRTSVSSVSRGVSGLRKSISTWTKGVPTPWSRFSS